MNSQSHSADRPNNASKVVSAGAQPTSRRRTFIHAAGEHVHDKNVSIDPVDPVMDPTDSTIRETPVQTENIVVELLLDEEACLTDPNNNHAYFLDQIAFEVWRHCDGRTTSRQMAERLMDKFDMEPGMAVRHLEELSTWFTASGLTSYRRIVACLPPDQNGQRGPDRNADGPRDQVA